MLITHKGHTDTIQVYSVTVMTHVKALQAGHSSQGTSEPITPAWLRETPYTTLLSPPACIMHDRCIGPAMAGRLHPHVGLLNYSGVSAVTSGSQPHQI